jgi:3-deoxy-D-manno-octulosonate 8-phosphate phosphatase (KDO 8-P phosphatase)
VLDRAGLSVTVADADPFVKKRVHWVTENAGGRNAAREICQLILAAHGLDRILLQEFVRS